MKAEFTAEAIKGVPAVAGTAWYALTLNQAVAVATLVYVGLQVAYLARKWWKEERAERQRKRRP